MSNIDINDVMAALQLIQEQKATKPVEAAPTVTREKKKRELSPEHLAKMQAGKKAKAKARASAAAESAPVEVPVAACVHHWAGAAPVGATFTLKSPHGNLVFTACANKKGQPYITCKVHEGQGGTLVLRTMDELKAFLWPLRTCEVSELEGLCAFVEEHKRA